MKTAVFIVIILVLLLSACNVNQVITLSADQSGAVKISVDLKPSYALYLKDLSEATTDSNNLKDGIFDSGEIEKSLEIHKGVKVTAIQTSNSGLDISMDFENLVNLFASDKTLGRQKVLTMTKNNSVITLKFNLNKQNYSGLTDVFPILNKPVFQSFAPQPDEDITEREYLDMTEFALGERGPGEVRDSELEVKVRIKGTVISQKGGTLSGNMVTFKIPLLKILLLNRSVNFEITFK
ncbi:MAG: hypothetical protein JW969_04775 [Spirochaetales bacterium]|nr:hypothetical protein [Spirochaetales bacterium]